MLKIEIEASEIYNEATNEFIYIKPQTLQLEHSLISISKWEAKWHKPFIPRGKLDDKTDEELIDYVKCMTLGNPPSPEVYLGLSKKNFDDITEYINDPMTASTVSSTGGSRGRSEIITSELIYYWMVAYQVPFECEKWHLNRLLMLLRICGAKNQPPKKMSRGAIISRNKQLNAMRRAQLNSKG